MKKLSPTFFIYFFILMLVLAFIFPLAHCAYEGFQEGSKNPAKQQAQKAIERKPVVKSTLTKPVGSTQRLKKY
jgi:hypothetical protein